MPKFRDLSNQQFNDWTVGTEFEKRGVRTKTFWKCICKCGTERFVYGVDITSGKSTGCGCTKAKKISKAHTKHGKSNSKLYKRWQKMKERCDNPANKDYHRYGARGVSVFKDWYDFNVFEKWCIDNGYSEGTKLEIDRIDNNGDYSPINCRFTTHLENMQNYSNNVYVGDTTLYQWLRDISEVSGIDRGTLWSRYNSLKKRGIEPTAENLVNYVRKT